MPFQIIRNDITRVAADAIVNTANPDPVIGGGTDSAIYQAAGMKKLLAERKKIGPIKPGDAHATPAFALHARYIIHTVGPVWIDGRHGENDVLRTCYAHSLELADTLGCTSIAFPLIATGVYGFPKEEALEIALAEIGKFLLTHDMDVTLVVFSRASFEISAELFGEINAYIDEHTVERLSREEYDFPMPSRYADERRRMRHRKPDADFEIRQNISFQSLNTRSEDVDGLPDDMICERCIPAEPKCSLYMAPAERLEENLEDFLENDEDTFQQRLMKLIIDSGMDDVTVYKRANIDRKLFSFIRSHEKYTPKKQTAIAFGIALKLSMPVMEDLLNRAGYAFSPASKSDLIISYFITHGNYNIFEINAALFKYEQKTLGGS